MLRNIFLISIVFWGINLWSNDEAYPTFSEDQFMWYVRNYHPVAVQSGLVVQAGTSTIRQARGAFDPVLEGDLKQKYFDRKTYYSLLGTGLKVPTWYGIELSAGYDQNRGAFLNPQNTVLENGLWYAGISFPLGQGLVIDERRAALKQAKLFAQSTLAERQKMLNDLLFKASMEYWKWTKAYNQYQIYEEAVDLAVERFEAVKLSYELGELPAIDTLEALIQVQDRQTKRNQYLLLYQNMTLELSNFLWFENNTPLEISDTLRPPQILQFEFAQAIPEDTLFALLDELTAEHPEIQLLNIKVTSMQVEERLKKEYLKPEINLDYNALFGNDPESGFVGSPTTDYQWGVGIKFPIPMRSQRGALELTRIKIQDTEIGARQKLLELQNTLRSFYNEQLNLKEQMEIFNDAVGNYESLLIGEQKKFTAGESSLFLLNSREIRLIQARIKLMDLVTNYEVAQNGMFWATGKFYESEEF